MSQCTYQVFLSSSDDTSINFSDHLYTALVRSGIHTCRADDGIERGHNMQSECQRATEESRISVIVFSKGYASSGRCLDELLNVLQRRKAVGHRILPVYYNVDPSEVGKQTGSFGEAFANHEEQFIAATDGREKDLMENVERWRAGLREVAKLRGMVLQNQSDGFRFHVFGTERVQGLIFDMHILRKAKSSMSATNVTHTKREHPIHDGPDWSWKRRRLSLFSWQRLSTAFPKVFPSAKDANFRTDTFSMMPKLRLLQLNYVQLGGSYKRFPRKLRLLCWYGFPLKSIPDDFPLENLVSLDFRHSNLEQLWKGTKVEGLFQLEAIKSFHPDIINTLGFLDLESKGKMEVELCNNLTLTRKRGHLQGFYEFGIFSIFLPGSKIPASFSNKSLGSSISFVVPFFPNVNVQGLNVCVVYVCSNSHKDGNLHDFHVKFINNTKGLEWTYGPTIHGNEEMIWLSHWNVRNQLQAGDELNVSMVLGVGFEVKECGADFVYEQEEKWPRSNSGGCTQSISGQGVIQHHDLTSHQSVIGGDLSAYERSQGVYLLCHYGQSSKF
ncbi:hypothetical protein RHMOL_Rhmol11G0179600 [Rhododendron molle]|uniref:Uncharacterized protein n=1 Tax=Rhododendron molle TaxID=49168 RepID=A0ACC0LU27_RHOML|nr:hypothetical protein RHMOL_Rhmol11G0179600 [Rhododendron molle]